MASNCGVRACKLPSSTGSVLESTAQQLFLEVKREAEELGEISEDLMSALLFVFQAPLHQALDLLDRGAVTRYSCPAGRELFRVRGSGGRSYTCLTSSNYCSCPSFVYSVLVKEDSLLCKHMLAVQLGRAIGQGKRGGTGETGGAKSGGLPRVDEVCVSDEDFAGLLMKAAMGEQEVQENEV